MRLTVVMPIYNGESTLEEVFKSLEQQEDKHLVQEVILINDTSRDASLEMARAYAAKSSYNTRVIHHERNKGLASTYNEGLDEATTDMVVLMHQDIYLQDPHSLAKVVAPFERSTNVVATHPFFTYTHSVWKKDNFWLKVLFSRLVDKKVGKMAGKFDCINKTLNIRFDSRTYRTAGEDFDFETRMRAQGEVAQADLEVTHLHSNDPSFSLKKLIKKEAQLAECYGVNLRRHLGATPFKDIILILARPAFIVGVLLPVLPIRIVAGLLLVAFCFYYSWRVYRTEYRDLRILALPFVNLFNIASYSALLVKGLIAGRQRI